MVGEFDRLRSESCTINLSQRLGLIMNKGYLFGAVVAAQLVLAGAAMADTGPVYSAYQGSQLGVTERNAGLVQ